MPSSSLTIASAIAWTAFHQFQSGYHISALNGIQSSLTCDIVPITPFPGGTYTPYLPSWATAYVGPLSDCVAMTPARFGIIVAMFTLGALSGSFLATYLNRCVGRIGALRVASALCLLGSLGFAVSNSVNSMIVSRLLVGLGCGFTGVTAPLLLTEIAPSLRNNLGILNQVSMVCGLIVSQSLGVPLAQPFIWRYMLLLSVAMAALLLFGSIFYTDEICNQEHHTDEEAPLLQKSEHKETIQHMTFSELMTTRDREIRRGFAVIVATQIAHQASGISPLVYFSTSILRPVFGRNAGLIAIAILLVKLPAAAASIPLLPRFGSRKILVSANLIMCLSLVALALGLNFHWSAVSSLAILVYIVAFGSGPGPVTFVVLSEVLPPEARTAAGSMGITLNAIVSFVVSSTFLPLQQLLMINPTSGAGNIFLIFAFTCAASAIAIQHFFKRYEAVILA